MNGLTKLFQETWRSKRYRWMIIGILLSFLGPFGEWLFLQAFQSQAADIVALTYLYTELWTLLCFSIFGYYLGRNAEIMEHRAYNDALTDLYSRGYIIEKFKELLAVQRRYQQPLSVMLLDLDHFKLVNDRYGHLVGDKTLKAVSHCLKKSCRESDLIGRYGGEEILVLCQNLLLPEAMSLAERIRSNIENLASDELGYPGPLTVSIGLLDIPEDNTLSMESLFKLVDEALYAAKKRGRNQISIASLEHTFIDSELADIE